MSESPAVSIHWSGEASENFADIILNRMSGWYVEVEPEDGSARFDAIIKGTGRDYYDALVVLRADPDSGLPLEPEQRVELRVKSIFVY